MPYLRILRVHYWSNNVFILPGIALAALYVRPFFTLEVLWGVLAGIASSCIVASSNYVLNEVLDAESDKHHPDKRMRPVPSGEVIIPVAYAMWLGLALAGWALAFSVNAHLGWASVAFWLSGTLYNVPPVRLKDRPYVDVLMESLNNPIRLAIGWFSTGIETPPPLSIALAYWMFGAFLMATKRFAEFRKIGCHVRAAGYRKSFGHYTEARLLESLFFYAALFGMLSGVFMAQHHMDLALATPLVAYSMAYYLHLGFKPDSPVQHPELLYKQKKLMILVTAAFLACVALLLIDVPGFPPEFSPLARN
jgi:4-hydroxybenzoate polyprenyltransferase